MDNNQILYLILLIVCVLLAAFFASSETAFFSLQRVRVEQMVSDKVKGADRLSRLIKRPDKLLSIILLGTNLAITAATSLATVLAVAIWDVNGIIIATVTLTIVVLVFAETTPKTLAHIHAEKLSLFLTRPLEILSWILSPFAFVLSWIAALATRVFGGTPATRLLVSQEEIRTMITTGHKDGTMEETEAKMLHKVFEFGKRPVREVMVPRTEVIWVEKGTTLDNFLKIYSQFPMSRFPVFEENTDNVVGVLAVKDVLMAYAKESMNLNDRTDSLIRAAYFTPESKLIDELFVEMKDKNYRLAVIVDEYGGTAGIVSLSLLVEEIVGAVGDEFAEADKEYEEIDEFTYQIDGGMNIDEANSEMALQLPASDNYKTVAGFILSMLGRIPRTGERLRYKDIILTIIEMRGMKIEKVLLRKPKNVREDAASKS